MRCRPRQASVTALQPLLILRWEIPRSGVCDRPRSGKTPAHRGFPDTCFRDVRRRGRLMKRTQTTMVCAAAALTAACAALFALVGSPGVTAATTVAPTNTSPPTITGTAQEGQTLVGHRGTWSGNPTDYNDFWVRCNKDGGSCANISGANNRNGYLLKAVDVGNTIRFKVQAKNADGSATESSVPTAVVTAATKPPPPVSNGCAKTGGTVPVASVTPPARLMIDQTQISPSTITYHTRSVTARLHVSACRGSVE